MCVCVYVCVCVFIKGQSGQYSVWFVSLRIRSIICLLTAKLKFTFKKALVLPTFFLSL